MFTILPRIISSSPGPPAEVEFDRIPELSGEIERLRGRCWGCGYAAGEGRSVTTKLLRNTLRVSGCNVFG